MAVPPELGKKNWALPNDVALVRRRAADDVCAPIDDNAIDEVGAETCAGAVRIGPIEVALDAVAICLKGDTQIVIGNNVTGRRRATADKVAAAVSDHARAITVGGATVREDTNEVP